MFPNATNGWTELHRSANRAVHMSPTGIIVIYVKEEGNRMFVTRSYPDGRMTTGQTWRESQKAAN